MEFPSSAIESSKMRTRSLTGPNRGITILPPLIECFLFDPSGLNRC